VVENPQDSVWMDWLSTQPKIATPSSIAHVSTLEPWNQALKHYTLCWKHWFVPLNVETIRNQCAVYGSWSLIVSKPGSFPPERSCRDNTTSQLWSVATCSRITSMMMIAFITIKSSLVPLIEGLCAQIYFRFEISVVCSHLLLERKNMLKENKKAVSPDFYL